MNRGKRAAATNGGFSSGGEWSGQAAMANGQAVAVVNGGLGD